MATIKKIMLDKQSLPPRKRVAAYARISMETEQMLHSLSAQVSYYSKKIQSNPQWEYAGVYFDEGITGTSIAGRGEFKRLLADCDAGKIDIVLVKSISRFARDTVDCLNTVRHLKDIGVEVRFEREGIATFSADGELLLTLLASFAQAESESISTNIKWALRKKFEKGIPNGHKQTFGYNWDGVKYRIIPEQGEIVKEIFKRYIEGESGYAIAKDLKMRGVIGNNGVPLDASTIKDIVTNPSYTGTMILQKHYHNENHVRKLNRGELPRYAVEDVFEPLVSFKDYERAVIIRQKRAEAAPNRNPQHTKFAGKIKCGNCGAGVSRRGVSRNHPEFTKKWVCNTRERKGTSVCDMHILREMELETATESVVGKVTDDEFCRLVEKIVVYGDRIEFYLNDGRVKNVGRKYGGTLMNNGFKGRLFCGKCGTPLRRFSWKPCVKAIRWGCPAPKSQCTLKVLTDDELRRATASILEVTDGEPAFVERVRKMQVFDDKLRYELKDGTVKIWQRE